MTHQPILSRRTLLAGAAGAAAAMPVLGRAQAPMIPPAAQLGTPPSTITLPPRDWTRGHPSIYPDPDVIVLDPVFRGMVPGNAGIHRLWTGAQWAEGPAWSSQGQYLVFSDVSGNAQYRYLWDDGRVTAFRKPSNNTNGNSFDFQGRQLSCEDFNRRVVRWEHDGSMTVIADSYDGKPLNSPNDVVPHPDGSIWFTDPPYGGQEPEGQVDKPGGPSNSPPGGHGAGSGNINPRIGGEDLGGQERSLPTNVYRAD